MWVGGGESQPHPALSSLKEKEPGESRLFRTHTGDPQEGGCTVEGMMCGIPASPSWSRLLTYAKQRNNQAGAGVPCSRWG